MVRLKSNILKMLVVTELNVQSTGSGLRITAAGVLRGSDPNTPAGNVAFTWTDWPPSVQQAIRETVKLLETQIGVELSKATVASPTTGEEQAESSSSESLEDSFSKLSGGY